MRRTPSLLSRWGLYYLTNNSHKLNGSIIYKGLVDSRIVFIDVVIIYRSRTSGEIRHFKIDFWNRELDIATWVFGKNTSISHQFSVQTPYDCCRSTLPSPAPTLPSRPMLIDHAFTMVGCMVLPLHHLWYLVSRTLFVKGLNKMLRGLEVSRSLIVIMILCVNISDLFRWNYIILWHLSWHIGILQMIVLRFSRQEEDIIEHTNVKCNLCTL